MSECERLRNTFGSLWGHARNWESRAALAPFLAIFCALAFLPFKYHSTSDICTHTHRHVTVLNDVGTCQKESELRGIRKKTITSKAKRKEKGRSGRRISKWKPRYTSDWWCHTAFSHHYYFYFSVLFFFLPGLNFLIYTITVLSKHCCLRRRPLITLSIYRLALQNLTHRFTFFNLLSNK